MKWPNFQKFPQIQNGQLHLSPKLKNNAKSFILRYSVRQSPKTNQAAVPKMSHEGVRVELSWHIDFIHLKLAG